MDSEFNDNPYFFKLLIWIINEHLVFPTKTTLPDVNPIKFFG